MLRSFTWIGDDGGRLYIIYILYAYVSSKKYIFILPRFKFYPAQGCCHVGLRECANSNVPKDGYPLDTDLSVVSQHFGYGWQALK